MPTQCAPMGSAHSGDRRQGDNCRRGRRIGLLALPHDIAAGTRHHVLVVRSPGACFALDCAATLESSGAWISWTLKFWNSSGNSRIPRHVIACSSSGGVLIRKLSFLTLSLMVTATMVGAQNNQANATARLKGKVLDFTNLPMAGVTVKVYRGTTEPKEGIAAFKEGVTDNNGVFDLEVPPGEYYIVIWAPDFDAFKQAVRATATMEPLSVRLTVTRVEGGFGIESSPGLTQQ
jgi:hypothetical protein